MIQLFGFRIALQLKPVTALVCVGCLGVLACGDILGVDFDVTPRRSANTGEEVGTSSGGGAKSRESTATGNDRGHTNATGSEMPTSGSGGSSMGGSEGSAGEPGATDASASTDTSSSGGASGDRASNTDPSSSSTTDGSSGEAGSTGTTDGQGGEAGGSGEDPPVVRRCNATAPFTAVEKVGGISGAAALAHYSQDELTVYYVAATGSVLSLVRATRPTVDDAFGTVEPVGPWNQMGVVASPSLTADGLTLYLDSAATGQFRIHSAFRNTQDAAFPVPTVVSEIIRDVGEEGGPFITATGDELYFHSTRNGNSKLFRAIHTAFGFETVEELGVSTDDYEESFPAVAANGLALYFSRRPILNPPDSNTTLWRAIRSNVTEDFADSDPVTEPDSPAVEIADWISMDNCRLYFSRMPADILWAGSSLFVASRDPEEP